MTMATSQVQPLTGFASMLRILVTSGVMQIRENIARNTFLFTLTAQPVLFALLSVGLYRYGNRPDLSVYGVIGSGLVGMWNSNLWTSGFIVQNERRGGTIELLMASPTSMMVVLFGRSLANALTSVLAIGVTFLTGIVALGVPLGLEQPVGFMIALLLTVLALTALGLIFATLFILTRAAGRMAEVANYPIFILSGLTFPLTTLPLWTRPLSFSLAPAWGNLALNSAAGIGTQGLLVTYAWLIGLGTIYYLIGLGLHRWIERIARGRGGLQEF